jgi:ribosomal protein S3AE
MASRADSTLALVRRSVTAIEASTTVTAADRYRTGVSNMDAGYQQGFLRRASCGL